MANIIIMNLSSLKPKSIEEPYESDLGILTGKNTADAPMKYLIEYFKYKNQKIDKILTVVTSQAKEAFSKLKSMLSEYDSSVVEPIEIEGDNQFQTVNDVIKHVNPNDKIYIEATGGLRNTTYTLMTIVRILEYSGVILEKAIYSNHSTDKSVPNRIEDITDTYRTFNLINAVNSFTSYGSSYELENYFDNTDNTVIKETIRSMKNFSDDITLCRTSQLDKTLKNLNDSLVKLTETPLESKDSALFKSLADVIRSKFYMNKESKKIEYPDVVRWCIDNKLIQQAVTIYVEKMPQYFYEKKFYSVSNDTLEIMKTKNEKSNFGFEYELFYSGMMNDSSLPEDASLFKNIIGKAYNTDKDMPFRRKTDEEIIAQAFSDCDNMSVFNSRINSGIRKKYKLDILNKKLPGFFKFKRMIYDQDGKKYTNINLEERLKDYPEIINMAQNNLNAFFPNTSESFLSVINNNAKLLGYIFDVKNEYSDNHLNFLSSFENRTNNSSYTINEKVNMKDAHLVFMDIYFAKTFIRNKLNHASEDDSNEEFIRFFSDKEGYIVDTELSVEYISKFISNALDRINNLSL